MAGNKMIKMLVLIALATFAFTGCSGDDSSPVTPSVIVDQAPPVGPSGVYAAYDAAAKSVTLSWPANTVDADLVGYVVERDVYGEVVDLVANPTMIHSFTDPAPQVGKNVYRVFAVDDAGNLSAAATAQFAFGNAHDDGRDRGSY